jgi:hypothetical protein
MIFDILPFWGMALACYFDGQPGKALIVAIGGPALVLIDDALRQYRLMPR